MSKRHLRAFLGAKKGKREWVERALDAGTPATARDEHGTSLLEAAVGGGDREIVELLLSRGAELDEEARADAVALARARGDESLAAVVEQFVWEEPSDPFAKRQALAKAAREGDGVALRRLLARGHDPNVSRYNGSGALHWAANRGDLEMVALLLDHGAKPNATGCLGTPIHAAVVSAKVEVIELLLARGAQVHARDSTGESALERARRGNQSAMVELLLSHTREKRRERRPPPKKSPPPPARRTPRRTTPDDPFADEED